MLNSLHRVWVETRKLAGIDDDGDGGDDDYNHRDKHPAARTELDMLTAVHDAEIGEEERGNQQRPEGAMEVSSKRSHKADANTKEKSVDARSNGEEQHTEDACIETKGHRLGFTAHVRPHHLDGHNST